MKKVPASRTFPNLNITRSTYFYVNVLVNKPGIVGNYGKTDHTVSLQGNGYYAIFPLNSILGKNTYTLKTMTSVCGTQEPALTASIPTNIQCADSPVLVNYSIKGDFDLNDDYIRFDLIDQRTQKKYSLDLKIKASARFASEIINYQPDTNPKAVVLFEGDSPFNYVYGTDLVRQNKYTQLSIDPLIFYQASPSVYYKLFSVRNVCGVGTIGNPSTVRVELVIGTEDPVNQMQITVMPNPTSDFVTIKFSAAGPRKISIYSKDEKLLLKKSLM